ncbi:hypothetical protein [Tenacibaculum singaporense]|uniref:Uncharacterized protein n=1 Tax=Tenacibaculum singaporense TaxID=2358479 RepID=A0A3Q8RS08_9FLAO|nr:hypothetical protein [Tenacibaculum singaporense]AZJ36077.1 hypothetical protein D6T69_11280 [Tenacibaculum singaporense]
MKQLQNFVLVGVAFMMLQACQKEDTANELLNNKNLEVKQARAYYAPWVYVMDWRFSRGTCTTGPGVCFKNDYGDILVYGNASSGSSDEVKEIFSKLMEGNNDEDNGVIAFRNEGESLRLIFSRSLEEEDFIISEEISLRDDIVKELGETNITLQAGKYVVDYSRFKNGEVLIPLKN